MAHVSLCHVCRGQANVYYSRTPTGEEFAIKIFKTSILVFKDRDRYVSGTTLARAT